MMRTYFSGKPALLAALVLGISTLPACSVIQQSPPAKMVKKMGANQVLRFTESNLMPPILFGDDVGMACASGESMTPLVEATGNLGADNDQMGTLLYTTAAICAERHEAEEELRYMRALADNLVNDAQDARTAQKRWAAVAARRQYSAYRHATHYYESTFNIKIGETCPSFASDFDEMVYLVGMLSGLQAIMNDVNSQNIVSVPKDIAPRVGRAMKCLDSEKWFGVPMAINAAIWSLLPGAGGDQDPWQTFKDSSRAGERHGVRLANALYVITAYSKADEKHLRDALKAYASTDEVGEFKASPQFRLLDSMAEMEITEVSDRYWTEHTGARTPYGSMGVFWDEQAKPGSSGASSGINIDNL